MSTMNKFSNWSSLFYAMFNNKVLYFQKQYINYFHSIRVQEFCIRNFNVMSVIPFAKSDIKDDTLAQMTN